MYMRLWNAVVLLTRALLHAVQDKNNSGLIAVDEIKRAMFEWNVELSDAKLALLLKSIDTNGDGQINYTEFCDGLARDTVAPAALGKHGMQSLEAMGVSAFELMDKQLGHSGKIKNYKMPSVKDFKVPTLTNIDSNEASKLVNMAQDVIALRFSDMHKAFRHFGEPKHHPLTQVAPCVTVD